MLRRNSRLRREYLYRKSLEADQRSQYEKKRLLRNALQTGQAIPTELRHEAFELRQQLQLDDNAHSSAPTSHIDDEYALAGKDNPKICLTTSRDPSSRLIAFNKELRLCLPNSVRINRGGTQINELITTVRNNNFTDLIIVHEHRGEPDGLIVCHLPYGPTAYFGLRNVVLRHDIRRQQQQSASEKGSNTDDSEAQLLGTVSEAYPHLIFDNFNSKLGLRTSNILKYLYPTPKPDSRRTISFVNRNDTISFRHHIYKKLHGKDQYELNEVGPRFEMSLYQIRLGTIEMTEAENEWVLRPFMNTAKRRKLL